jgi:hypothetical protein
MEKGDAGKRRVWTRHIRSWRASGLTRRAYCAREGVALSTFDYWRRRIPDVKIGQTQEGPDQTLTLVPICVEPTTRDGALELHSPTGWRLTLPASVGSGFVGNLLKRLS